MQRWQAKTSVNRGALDFLDRLQLVGPPSPEDSPSKAALFLSFCRRCDNRTDCLWYSYWKSGLGKGFLPSQRNLYTMFKCIQMHIIIQLAEHKHVTDQYKYNSMQSVQLCTNQVDVHDLLGFLTTLSSAGLR